MSHEDLTALVKRASALYDSYTAFGRAINRSSVHAKRLIEETPKQPEVTTCIRIAHLLAVSPRIVLTAAGMADVADFLEESYGPPREQPMKPTLTETQARVLERWEALTPETQEVVMTLMEVCAQRSRKKAV